MEVFLEHNDGFLGNWGTNNFYFYRFENKNLFTFITCDKNFRASSTFMIRIDGVCD